MRPTSTHFRLAITITSLCIVGLFMSVSAQGCVFWEEGGVVLCESTAAIGLCAVPDGSGGAIVAWPDYRGRHESVWARRVDHAGNPRWQADGVLLRGEARLPIDLSACSGSGGGMIVCWTVSYDGAQVGAQRVDSSGMVRWGPTGVVVAGSAGDRDYYASLVRDGRGGAIVVWLRKQLQPERLDSLCVQRLDSLGRPCWGPDGVLVSADTLAWAPPCICTDGLGGAFVAWTSGPGYTPWVQHADSSGRTSWPAPGVRVCSTAIPFMYVWDAVPSGHGCALAFYKGWIGEDGIWAQLVDTSGRLQWGPDGACVHPGVGGRIWDIFGVEGDSQVTYWLWTEKRAGIYDVYAQQLDGQGRCCWDSLGLWVGTVGSDEEHTCAAMPDTRGGLVVSWPRFRNGNWDLSAQRIDSDGFLSWGDSGLAVVDDTLRQSWEPALVSDGRQGAVVFWDYSFATPQGYRSGVNAQRIGDATAVNEDDSLVGPSAMCCLRPSPARGLVFIHVDRHDAWDFIEIVAANGAVVRKLGSSAGRREPLIWNCRDARGRKVPAGVYLCRETRSSRALGKIVLVPK